MDLGDVCIYAMKVVEDMTDQFGEHAVIRQVAIVLDVETEDSTVTVMSCDDDRQWLQLAFLEEARLTVEEGSSVAALEDDED